MVRPQRGGALRIEVNGNPVTQGSKVISFTGGGAYMREARAGQLTVWRNSVAIAARQAMRTGIPPGESWFADGVPVEIAAEFRLPLPRTTQRRYPTSHRSGDLDKLIRAVGDALTDARVLGDDAQIVRIDASKVHAGIGHQPGVAILLTPIDPQPHPLEVAA